MTSRAIHAVDGTNDPLGEAVERRVRSAGSCVERDVPRAGVVSMRARMLGRGAP